MIGISAFVMLARTAVCVFVIERSSRGPAIVCSTQQSASAMTPDPALDAEVRSFVDD